MKTDLEQKIARSIQELSQTLELETGRRGKKLNAIGFVTTDDVLTIGAKLLYEGDLPQDADLYQQLSPVEWFSSEESAFSCLNQFLASTFNPATEEEEDYKRRVRMIFDGFTNALNQLDIRAKFGSTLYLTFSGVDPNPTLENEEKRFVSSMNPSSVFDQWCEEFD